MKNTLLTLILIGCCSFGYAQDVKVNINNQDATPKDDCPFRINGICATDDIGGVDVNFTVQNVSSDGTYYHTVYLMMLTNYNQFPVNVLWQIEYTGSENSCQESVKTGYVVIGAEGQKIIQLDSECNYKYWSVKGLIVRKLAQ